MCVFSLFSLEANASDDKLFVPYIIDFSVTPENYENVIENSNVRATGLIYSYSLSLSKSGTTLNISGLTNCTIDVVKCGFKDLTVQRRKTDSDAWKDYYEFGNVYVDVTFANLSTSIVVESGYQYRISCKHYAKKNILSVQTIANTSNIVNV